MLRGIYSANADGTETLVTPEQAEEEYRLKMAALVESSQIDSENAPIILPAGFAKNEEAKDRQKRERAEFIQLLRQFHSIS